MKSNLTQVTFTVATLFLIPFAHAGFTFETPVEPVVAAAPSPRLADVRIPLTTVGARRNVNPSASGERISKLNRQRIDLESRVSSRITQSGNSPTELQSIRGMGSQVTFEDALRQVLPAGWTVYSDQEAPLDKHVDWQGARTWPMVMHSLLTALDMRAHIDWDAQELMLFVPAPKMEKPAELVAHVESVVVDAPIMESQTKITPAAATPSAAFPLVVEPVIAQPIAVAATSAISVPKASAPSVNVNEIVWSVKPGSLRENLRVLAAQAGWTLVWNATIGDMTVNYDVEEPGFQFTGSLIGADGVIGKVIDLYAQAEHPLAVTFFHGNKVVEVTLHQVPDAKTNPSNGAKVSPQRAVLPPQVSPLQAGPAMRSDIQAGG